MKSAKRPHLFRDLDRRIASFDKKIERIFCQRRSKLHRFPEQRCINDADENALEHGLSLWASVWGQIVFGRIGVIAA